MISSEDLWGKKRRKQKTVRAGNDRKH